MAQHRSHHPLRCTPIHTIEISNQPIPSFGKRRKASAVYGYKAKNKLTDHSSSQAQTHNFNRKSPRITSEMSKSASSSLTLFHDGSQFAYGCLMERHSVRDGWAYVSCIIHRRIPYDGYSVMASSHQSEKSLASAASVVQYTQIEVVIRHACATLQRCWENWENWYMPVIQNTPNCLLRCTNILRRVQ